jgi:hypothetical protein
MFTDNNDARNKEGDEWTKYGNTLRERQIDISI